MKVLTTCISVCFFFNDTATTEIYTLSLHDALPICCSVLAVAASYTLRFARWMALARDRKSTRLNSSHDDISYAVFCLKKKNTKSGQKECNMGQTGISVRRRHPHGERLCGVQYHLRTKDATNLKHTVNVISFLNDRPPTELYPLSPHGAFRC